MLEQCDHCQALAPGWDDERYAGWYLGVTGEGVYLGVICPGCFAGDGIAFLTATTAS